MICQKCSDQRADEIYSRNCIYCVVYFLSAHLRDAFAALLEGYELMGEEQRGAWKTVGPQLLRAQDLDECIEFARSEEQGHIH